MPTISAYENYIKQFAAERGLHISRGQTKKVAYSFHKRQARMTDLELERVFMHSDPTPRDAFRSLAAQGHPLMAVAA